MNSRNLNKNKLLLVKNNKEQIVNNDKILREFNVNGIIRLTPREYTFATDKNIWSHWNLFPANHKKGERFLIAEIIRHGSLTNNIETLPLINIKDKFITISLDITEPITIENVTKFHLKNNYPWITSTETLSESILNKYSQSMPDISEEKLIQMPLAITILKKLEN